MNIPTILAFEGGEVKQRIVGAMPKAKLVAELGASWAERGAGGLGAPRAVPVSARDAGRARRS